MTEDDWVGRAHPFDMLEHIIPRTSARKLRLLAAACCRALDRPAAADACEEVADGRADADALARVRGPAPRDDWWRNTWSPNPLRIGPGEQAARVVWAGTQDAPAAAARGAARHGFPQLQRRLTDLLLEIFGNPFRPPPPAAAWLAWGAGTVPRLARLIYDGRRWHDLPILADALEDAGCTDDALLEHFRGGALHVRGCWALDHLLANG